MRTYIFYFLHSSVTHLCFNAHVFQSFPVINLIRESQNLCRERKNEHFSYCRSFNQHYKAENDRVQTPHELFKVRSLRWHCILSLRLCLCGIPSGMAFYKRIKCPTLNKIIGTHKHLYIICR